MTLGGGREWLLKPKVYVGKQEGGSAAVLSVDKWEFVGL